MGEMTPSGSKGQGTGGAIVGTFIGVLLAVTLSVFGFGLSSAVSGGAPQIPGACRGGILAGVVLLGVAAAFGWLAWHMVFRNSSRTFGAGFLRGLSVVVAAFLLTPWPCSYTFAAYLNFTACGH